MIMVSLATIILTNTWLFSLMNAAHVYLQRLEFIAIELGCHCVNVGLSIKGESHGYHHTDTTSH